MLSRITNLNSTLARGHIALKLFAFLELPRGRTLKTSPPPATHRRSAIMHLLGAANKLYDRWLDTLKAKHGAAWAVPVLEAHSRVFALTLPLATRLAAHKLPPEIPPLQPPPPLPPQQQQEQTEARDQGVALRLEPDEQQTTSLLLLLRANVSPPPPLPPPSLQHDQETALLRPVECAPPQQSRSGMHEDRMALQLPLFLARPPPEQLMTPREVVLPPPVLVQTGSSGQVPPLSNDDSVVDVIDENDALVVDVINDDDEDLVEILAQPTAKKRSAPVTDQGAGHCGKKQFAGNVQSSQGAVRSASSAAAEPVRLPSTRIKDLKKRKLGTE
ncbi:hypothetical protein AMAG_04035 [Allomyces macrogynus ATCC 38327]|uniref:Uncharacterized protein n=1 Tax=Allomyces macrogynus (strain ATCC 38327) TaxID=578462 RepID=A0A0L0S806_ALLM3|nr:hypothetical protein AMAG_04035 [Allomyces macrogynus ATCC 38327]|eukprot:KNE58464.1 hypothetical protein AMAG_04035 [Allomyces macrogynus ATCC 38327]